MYREYLDASNLFGWAMSQKRSSNGLKWVEYLPQLIKTS